jgi:hypothetical protein
VGDGTRPGPRRCHRARCDRVGIDGRELRRERHLGALIPLGLKRLGADPATASSIFLTTATDVVSMGVFLSLATWLLL